MENNNIELFNYNPPLQNIDDMEDIDLIEPTINEESCINFEEYSECIFYPSDIDLFDIDFFVSYKQTENEEFFKEVHIKLETNDEEKYTQNCKQKILSSDSEGNENEDGESSDGENIRVLERKGRKSNQFKNKCGEGYKHRKSQNRSGKTIKTSLTLIISSLYNRSFACFESKLTTYFK